MYLTEEEARNKECKLMVMILALINAHSKQTKDINRSLVVCTASECMMWRWESITKDGAHSEKGCCGLAGKP